MAMSILYLHRDFSKDIRHEKVFKSSDVGSMGPVGPGPKWLPGPKAQAGPGPTWDQGISGPRAQGWA